jgi:hypothetical protein
MKLDGIDFSIESELDKQLALELIRKGNLENEIKLAELNRTPEDKYQDTLKEFYALSEEEKQEMSVAFSRETAGVACIWCEKQVWAWIPRKRPDGEGFYPVAVMIGIPGQFYSEQDAVRLKQAEMQFADLNDAKLKEMTLRNSNAKKAWEVKYPKVEWKDSFGEQWNVGFPQEQLSTKISRLDDKSGATQVFGVGNSYSNFHTIETYTKAVAASQG